MRKRIRKVKSVLSLLSVISVSDVNSDYCVSVSVTDVMTVSSMVSRRL